jgi:hypothetical protein
LPFALGSIALAVSPDGRLVASSTEGGAVRLFDASKGELIDTSPGISTRLTESKDRENKAQAH